MALPASSYTFRTKPNETIINYITIAGGFPKDPLGRYNFNNNGMINTGTIWADKIRLKESANDHGNATLIWTNELDIEKVRCTLDPSTELVLIYAHDDNNGAYRWTAGGETCVQMDRSRIYVGPEINHTLAGRAAFSHSYNPHINQYIDAIDAETVAREAKLNVYAKYPTWTFPNYWQVGTLAFFTTHDVSFPYQSSFRIILNKGTTVNDTFDAMTYDTKNKAVGSNFSHGRIVKKIKDLPLTNLGVYSIDTEYTTSLDNYNLYQIYATDAKNSVITIYLPTQDGTQVTIHSLGYVTGGTKYDFDTGYVSIQVTTGAFEDGSTEIQWDKYDTHSTFLKSGDVYLTI
jgi:hypothetical protein